MTDTRIALFLDMLAAERGAGKNTLDAYRHDLTDLAAHLKARGILAVSHYLPLNTSKVGVTFGGRAGDCPVTEHVADVLIRLPFFSTMTDDEQGDVIDALSEFQ